MHITSLLFALWLPLLAVALSQSGSPATTLTTKPSPISPRSISPALQSVYNVLDILSPGQPHPTLTLKPTSTSTSTTESGSTYIITTTPRGVVQSTTFTTLPYTTTSLTTTIVWTTISPVMGRAQQPEETREKAAFAPVNTDLPTAKGDTEPEGEVGDKD